MISLHYLVPPRIEPGEAYDLTDLPMLASHISLFLHNQDAPLMRELLEIFHISTGRSSLRGDGPPQ
jgi:hypothetical protein